MNFAAIAFIMLGILMSIGWISMDRFRKNIKEGDIVGVRFGEDVYVRVVRRVTPSDVMVFNKNMTTLTFVPKEDVFLSTSNTVRENT